MDMDGGRRLVLTGTRGLEAQEQDSPGLGRAGALLAR